jgi:hypothetical protein
MYLQTFRKEAIYRQMLEYKREYNRAADRLERLQAEKEKLALDVGCVEACWREVGPVLFLVCSYRSDKNATVTLTALRFNPIFTDITFVYRRQHPLHTDFESNCSYGM